MGVKRGQDLISENKRMQPTNCEVHRPAMSNISRDVKTIAELLNQVAE
jgi:hypothetical protein